ncbi:MAG: hypothetical protein V1720_01255 [bacterium]
MKQAKLLLILSFLFSSILVLAQEQQVNSGDSEVDIKALLQKQINEIREKEKAPAAPVKSNVKPVVQRKIETPKMNKAEMNSELFSKSEILKAFILLEAALLASLFIMWRRKNKSSDSQFNLKLKKNIRLLREERLATIDDSRLSKIRTRLNAQPIKVDDLGREIITKARKYSISKGEVHLAAKLKMLANSNR